MAPARTRTSDLPVAGSARRRRTERRGQPAELPRQWGLATAGSGGPLHRWRPPRDLASKAPKTRKWSHQMSARASIKPPVEADGGHRRHGAVSRSSDDAARATGASDRYPRMSFCDSSLTTEDSTKAATPAACHRRDHPGRRRALPQLFTFEVRAVSQVGQALVWLVIGRHERIQQPRVVGRRTVLHRTYPGWL